MAFLVENQIKRTEYVKRLAKELNVSEEVCREIVKAIAKVNLDVVSEGKSLPVFGLGNFITIHHNKTEYYCRIDKKYKPMINKYKYKFTPSVELKKVLRSDYDKVQTS